MQKRQLGIVLSLVVVVVGVAALLWLSLRSPRPIASRNEAAANAPPQAVVTAHEAAAERSELDRARSSVEPSPPARSEDAGEEDVPVLVRVVDGATEQPVPGARVLFWDEASWAARLAVPDDAALHTSGDDEDWLLAHGRIAHCDASGEVRIHATPLTVLRAEFEGAVGIGMLEHASEIRVAILPERSVAVRLLSADRRPVAGVEVGINALDAAGVPVCDHAMREVATDAAGLARFRHLQWPSQDLSALREAVPFAVRPSLPGCRSLFATFLPTSPPAEPIELVLPETGSLVLRWPAAGGNSNRYVSVQESGNCWSSTGRGRAQDEDVVFEHVPIGRRYRVYDGSTSREVDGPKVAGEVVLVELVDETTVSIALVLQDADGHVLAGRDCCAPTPPVAWSAFCPAGSQVAPSTVWSMSRPRTADARCVRPPWRAFSPSASTSSVCAVPSTPSRWLPARCYGTAAASSCARGCWSNAGSRVRIVGGRSARCRRSSTRPGS